jgi:hypothetical protein
MGGLKREERKKRKKAAKTGKRKRNGSFFTNP